MNEYNKNKKKKKKINKQLNLSINYIENLYKIIQLKKNEKESLSNIFTEFLEEIKKRIFFVNMNIKPKKKFFNHEKLKFNLEP